MIALNLKLAGAALVILGLMHAFLPRYFDWKNDMRVCSLINRQMMFVHAFFIGLVLLLMGVLCITSATELVSTELGKRITIGFGVFWLARLVVQFYGYSPELWRGKRTETGVHVLMTMLWVYLSGTFLVVPWMT